MEFTDVKASEPVRGVPPWRDPRWLADAQDWIDAECARAGQARAGAVLARGRPYSVVARVPTGGGTIWFKASPPASAFEPARLAALASWQPGRFTAPLAVDPDRAWSLSRDGGQHEALRAIAPRVRDWCAELDDLGIPPGLDHADVHPNNILAASRAGPGRPRADRAHRGLPPALDRGRAPRAAVDRALPPALRIAPFARALTWGRIFPC